MRLRTRFSLLLAVFSLALTLLAVLLTRALLLQTAMHTDNERALAVLDQASRVLQAETETLLRTVKDWASWDDTYAFAANHNQDYINSNLLPGTLDELRLNAIVYLNTNGQVTASITRVSEGVVYGSIPEWLSEYLHRPGGILDALEANGKVSGFLFAEGSLWLVAIAPILTSEDKGPTRGALLMMRHIDPSETARIAEMVHPSLSFSLASRAWPPGRPDVRAVSQQTIQAQTALQDALGSGRILLSVSLTRDAYNQLLLAMAYLTGWIVVCGAAMSLFAFFILNRWVLQSITDSVQALKAGVFQVTGDVHDRLPLKKLHDDEIGELVDAVNAALNRVEVAAREADRRRAEAMQAQKLASVGTLLVGVAHEINNPNGVVAINVNVVRRLLDRLFTTLRSSKPEVGTLISHEELESMESELDGATKEVLSASQRIAGLVSSLKAFSQPAAGNMTERVEIAETARKATEWVRHELKRKRCRLSLEIPDHLPAIKGNGQQILQVLINLIQNACDAADHPDTPIWVKAEHDAEHGTVVVAVVDQGRGIPREHLEHVLDPFFTLRRAEGGTGLGLSISAAIVRAHGGDIRLESEVGHGTTVTVSLPVEKEQKDVGGCYPKHNDARDSSH